MCTYVYTYAYIHTKLYAGNKHKWYEEKQLVTVLACMWQSILQ